MSAFESAMVQPICPRHVKEGVDVQVAAMLKKHETRRFRRPKTGKRPISIREFALQQILEEQEIEADDE